MSGTKCIPQNLPKNSELNLSPCACCKDNDHQKIFRQNTRDVASAIAKILNICGINEYKAHAAKDVIIDTFNNYDKIRNQIDLLPKKRIRKVELIHSLGTKCQMSLMEAQLTYSIIKRAFKAFYFGTTEFGIRNPLVEEQSLHNQECLWIHAAKRTAQIYAEYEGVFFTAQKKYEELIKRVYICLNERLKKRANQVKLPTCCCKGGAKKIISSNEDKTLSAMASDLILNCCSPALSPPLSEGVTMQEVEKNIPNHQLLEKFVGCTICKCPKFICDCNIDLKKGVFSQECSQGPFKCRWIPVGDTESLWDPCFTKSQEHICPIDCNEFSDLMSDTESEMEAEIEADTKAVCEESDDTDIFEEEESEENCDEVIEQPTIGAFYTTEAPIPDTTPIMLPDKICYGRHKDLWENEGDFSINQKNILGSSIQRINLEAGSSFTQFGDIILSDSKDRFSDSRNKKRTRNKNFNKKQSRASSTSQEARYLEELSSNQNRDHLQHAWELTDQQMGSGGFTKDQQMGSGGFSKDQNAAKHKMDDQNRNKSKRSRKDQNMRSKKSKYLKNQKGKNKRVDTNKSGSGNRGRSKTICEKDNRKVTTTKSDLEKGGTKCCHITSTKRLKKASRKASCKVNQGKCKHPQMDYNIDVYDSDDLYSID